MQIIRSSRSAKPVSPIGWRVIGRSAAVTLRADFLNNIVVPHFCSSAPIVYGLDVLTAVSLLLGILSASGASILNLWLGLHGASGEWLWTYFFLLVLMQIFAMHRYGPASASMP
jgi:hypothetical protein